MRYIVYIVLFCLFYLSAQSQSGVPSQTINGWIKNTYTVPDSGTVVSRRDTSWTPTKFGMTITWPRPGVDTTQWIWIGSRWIQDGIGTTIDTTSLSNRINLKLSISDTTAMLLPYLRKIDTANKWVQNVYSRNDSLFKQKNGSESFIHVFNTSGSGTVTSVGLSMPSAFTVNNSPVTGAGTLSVTGAGTTLQYIRGNGTLATLDTGAIPNFYLKVRGLLSGTSPITYSSTTGAIGITNANTSGTKGAATFSASNFSDNGSGLISLIDVITGSSCTNCDITFNSKGQITSATNGTLTPPLANASGAGDTLLINDTIKRLNPGFGINHTTTTTSITTDVDSTEIATQYDLTQLSFPSYANNGLSKDADTIQLGGPLVKTTNISVGTNELDIIAANGVASTTRFTIDNTNAVMSGRYEDFSSINTVYANQDHIQLISTQPLNSRRILIDSTTGIQIGENVSGIYTGIIIQKSTGRILFNGFPSLTQQTDTANIKPIGYNTTTGLIQPMASWVGSGSGVGANNANIDTVLRIGNATDRSMYLRKSADTGTALYFFGNSIGAGSSGLTVPLTQRFSGKVTRFFGMRERNLCQSGTTVQNNTTMLSNIPVKSDSLRGIIFEFGTNDITNENGTTLTYVNFIVWWKRTLDTCIARGWGSYMRDILLVSPAYFTIFSTPLARIQQYVNGIDSIHTVYGTSFVNMLNATQQYGTTIIPDALHPDSTGQDIWTKAIIDSFHYSAYDNGRQLIVNRQSEFDSIVVRNLKTGSGQTIPLGVDSVGRLLKMPYSSIIMNTPITNSERQFGAINIYGGIKSSLIQTDGYIKSGTSVTATGIDLTNMSTAGINLFYNGDAQVQGGVPFSTTRVIRLNAFGSNVVINSTSNPTANGLFVDNNISASASVLTGGVTSSTGFIGQYRSDASNKVYLYGFNRNTGSIAGNVVIGAASSNGGTSRVWIGQETDASLEGTIIGTALRVSDTVKLMRVRGNGLSTDSVLVLGADSIVRKVAQSSIASSITTLYSGDATLAGNRIISGGGNSLSVGTGGSTVSAFTVTSSGRVNLFSGITYDVDANNTDADYTVASNTIIAEVSDVLTTGRTLTLPSAVINGQSVTLLMRFSAGSNKYSLSAAVTDNATGSTFTTLDWGKTYDFMVDQSLAWRLIRKY